MKQQESAESLIRFQEAVIVQSRHTIDTFDRELHKLKEERLEIDKRERELKRSFAEAPNSIERAHKEISRLKQVRAGQLSGSLNARNRRRMSDTERKLARREAILAQLAEINKELGLENGEAVK